MPERKGSLQVSNYFPFLGPSVLMVFALRRKLTKRVEDLTQDSVALRPHLVPQLQALNNTVPELVNFGISVCVLCFSSRMPSDAVYSWLNW